MSAILEEKIATLTQALQEIAEGSNAAGRWLDGEGNECAEDSPNAEWLDFSQEEQAEWITAVHSIAMKALL